MINAIVSNVYDRNPDIIEKLHIKLMEEKRRIDSELSLEDYVHNPITPLTYNFMIHSASMFHRKDFLLQLLFETTVTNINVDT